MLVKPGNPKEVWTARVNRVVAAVWASFRQIRLVCEWNTHRGTCATLEWWITFLLFARVGHDGGARVSFGNDLWLYNTLNFKLCKRFYSNSFTCRVLPQKERSKEKKEKKRKEKKRKEKKRKEKKRIRKESEKNQKIKEQRKEKKRQEKRKDKQRKEKKRNEKKRNEKKRKEKKERKKERKKLPVRASEWKCLSAHSSWSFRSYDLRTYFLLQRKTCCEQLWQICLDWSLGVVNAHPFTVGELAKLGRQGWRTAKPGEGGWHVDPWFASVCVAAMNSQCCIIVSYTLSRSWQSV